MRVAILGAGAVGSAYGHLLAAGGHEVVLVDVWEAHVDAVNESGLHVDGAVGTAFSPHLVASTDAAAAEGAEAVLVLVKAFATEAAARAVADALAADTIVITLQNGLGNDTRLAAVLGPERIIQGSTTVAAQMRGPGHVAVAPATLAGQSLTVLGRPRSAVHAERCAQLAAALTGSRLPVQVLDDVGPVVWRKAAMAAAIGPLCAILGGTVADVLASEPALAVLRRSFAEVTAVATAEGVALDSEELWAHALDTYRTIGPHPPSLAVDIARGRPSEIDAQLGEIQRRGRAAGLATPAGDVLVTIVRSGALATA